MDQRVNDQDLASDCSVESNIIKIDSTIQDSLKELKIKIEMQKRKNAQLQHELNTKINDTQEFEDESSKLQKDKEEMHQRYVRAQENCEILKKSNASLERNLVQQKQTYIEEQKNTEKKSNQLKHQLIKYQQDYEERLALYSKNQFYPQHEALKQQVEEMTNYSKALESQLRQYQGELFKFKCEKSRRTSEEAGYYPLENFILRIAEIKCETTKYEQQITKISKDILNIRVHMAAKKKMKKSVDNIKNGNNTCNRNQAPAEMTAQTRQKIERDIPVQDICNITTASENKLRKTNAKWSVPIINIKKQETSSNILSSNKSSQYRMIKTPEVKTFNSALNKTSAVWSNRTTAVALPRISVNFLKNAKTDSAGKKMETEAKTHYKCSEAASLTGRNSTRVSLSPNAEILEHPRSCFDQSPQMQKLVHTRTIKPILEGPKKPQFVSSFFRNENIPSEQSPDFEKQKATHTVTLNEQNNLSKNTHITSVPATKILSGKPSESEQNQLLNKGNVFTGTLIPINTFTVSNEAGKSNSVQEKRTQAVVSKTVTATPILQAQQDIEQLNETQTPSESDAIVTEKPSNKENNYDSTIKKHNFSSYLLRNAVLREEKMPECNSPTQYYSPETLPEGNTPQDTTIVDSQGNCRKSPSSTKSRSQEEITSSPLDYEKHLEHLKQMMKSPDYQYQYPTRRMFDPKPSDHSLDQPNDPNTKHRPVMIQSMRDIMKINCVAGQPTVDLNEGSSPQKTEHFDFGVIDLSPEGQGGKEKPMFTFGTSGTKAASPKSLLDVFGGEETEQAASEFTLNFAGPSNKNPKMEKSDFRLMF